MINIKSRKLFSGLWEGQLWLPLFRLGAAGRSVSATSVWEVCRHWPRMLGRMQEGQRVPQAALPASVHSCRDPWAGVRCSNWMNSTLHLLLSSGTSSWVSSCFWIMLVILISCEASVFGFIFQVISWVEKGITLWKYLYNQGSFFFLLLHLQCMLL